MYIRTVMLSLRNYFGRDDNEGSERVVSYSHVSIGRAGLSLSVGIAETVCDCKCIVSFYDMPN